MPLLIGEQAYPSSIVCPISLRPVVCCVGRNSFQDTLVLVCINLSWEGRHIGDHRGSQNELRVHWGSPESLCAKATRSWTTDYPKDAAPTTGVPLKRGVMQCAAVQRGPPWPVPTQKSNWFGDHWPHWNRHYCHQQSPPSETVVPSETRGACNAPQCIGEHHGLPRHKKTTVPGTTDHPDTAASAIGSRLRNGSSTLKRGTSRRERSALTTTQLCSFYPYFTTLLPRFYPTCEGLKRQLLHQFCPILSTLRAPTPPFLPRG